MPNLVNDGGGTVVLAGGGGLQLVGGGTGGGLKVAYNTGANTVRLSQPVGGGTAFVGQNSGGVTVRPVQAPAIPQTDLLPLDLAAGGSFVVDLGNIIRFLDGALVASRTVDFGEIAVLTPDGTLHDLTSLMSWLDADNSGMPFSLPPGRYTFLNTSGGILANTAVRVQHVGPKNLI